MSFSLIARSLAINRHTLRNIIDENGLHTLREFSSLSDAELDQVVEEAYSLLPNAGERVMLGYLRGKG